MCTYICITLWSRFPWIALFIESFTHSFTPSFCSYFGTIASRYSSPCCMGVWQPRGSDSLDYNKHNHNNIISSSLPPWGLKSAGWRRRVANYLAILIDLRPSGIWLLDGGAERGRGGGDPFPWCEHPDCEIQGPVSCDKHSTGSGRLWVSKELLTCTSSCHVASCGRVGTAPKTLRRKSCCGEPRKLPQQLAALGNLEPGFDICLRNCWSFAETCRDLRRPWIRTKVAQQSN